MALLTYRKLTALKAGEWASDGGPRGGGVLVARKLKSGPVIFYFRYTGSDRTRSVLSLGEWDSSGKGFSLDDARRLADQWSTKYRNVTRDLHLLQEQEERERQRQEEQRKREAESAVALASASLGALLNGYVQQLKRDRKPSARAVERTFENHVRTPWPELWKCPAMGVSQDDLLGVVALVVNAGKMREAAKLRSYLIAAYNAAMRARQDARGLQALRELKITNNPAASLISIDGATQARERALSLTELRAYWRRIQEMSDESGALLRFHLLTGGQRVEQLARLTLNDFDADTKIIRLRDTKGRRKVPRNHDVPLIPAAIEAMEVMNKGLGPYLFTITAGESGASYYSVQHRLQSVVELMKEAGELEKGGFAVGDLRRTVETRLSAAGHQPFELAQLQSHGLGGVQARHYNKHDYLREKRKLLESLYGLLTPPNDRRSDELNEQQAEVVA